jgi:DNA-binding MarR family transcriptional regulator
MDAETRVHSEHASELRLWLRLYACASHIERDVRTRLRERFDTTLPRFDLMAQLEREPTGMKMNELGRRLMVTNGNVTGITDQLETEGLVERVEMPGDRRAYLGKLTARGRREFARMAAEHEAWIVGAFDALSAREQTQLHQLLGKLKERVAATAEQETP